VNVTLEKQDVKSKYERIKNSYCLLEQVQHLFEPETFGRYYVHFDFSFVAPQSLRMPGTRSSS
jgi:hypothetical protein